MPNRTISADGEAMSAEGQSRRAALRLFGGAIAAAPSLIAAPAQAFAGAAAVDPALTAVAAFDAARAAWQHAPDDDDIVDPLFAEFERTNQALGRATLTTREGARAVLSRLVEEEMQGVDENSPLRGAILNLLEFLERDLAAPESTDGRARP